MWVPEVLGLPEHVALCVRTILTTPRGSVVLDRDFGVDPDILDLPMPAARARYVAEVMEAIRRYEPRIRVSDITFSADGESGILTPRVVCILAT